MGFASSLEVRVSVILPQPEVCSVCARWTPFQMRINSSFGCAPSGQLRAAMQPDRHALRQGILISNL
jgi:hypothetical protein